MLDICFVQLKKPKKFVFLIILTPMTDCTFKVTSN